MLRKTSSVQKVGSGISSTMQGRKQPTQKEISEIREQKRAHTTTTTFSEGEDTQDLIFPREDYNKLTTKPLREIIKEKGLGRKSLCKLKKQELINIIVKDSG